MENNPNAISCKVVLLGEAGKIRSQEIHVLLIGVGKTSIISRYINNTFSTNSMSTTGASFAAKTMYFENYDKYLKFEIWDTAGQEKYRSLTKIFYKDASVAVLTYDITRKESFEEIRKYWVNQLKENAPKKLIIAIAANKYDMYENEEVDENEGRAFAKEIGAIFRNTSAKNATGIDELFKSIGNKYIDPNYEEGGTNIPVDADFNSSRRDTVKINRESKAEKKGGCCK